MERRAIAVTGIVQGVGFRPYVHGLASGLGLRGSVRNQSGALLIEVEGEPTVLDRFLDVLASEPPPLAQIDRLAWERRPTRDEEDPRFRIDPSEDGTGGQVFISPDVATCDDCLAELFDPSDRRHRYPFINCTNCGPRLTIVSGAPYDRERTAMAPFPLCDDCRAEYDDPRDRRHHAQANACPRCGPRLRALDARGVPVESDDPLGYFADVLRRGGIGALKGLGGFHLACDARNGAAVAELRRRKHRDEKPFAIMVRDVDAAGALCEVVDGERALLQSPARPIVLLRKRGPDVLAVGIAPGNPNLGVLLPYTPLHHLLLDALGGIPLVMTSGNRSDEPIAYRDDDAIGRLAGIADVFLTHDRAINVRCDDSLTRLVAGRELPLRRSRGHAPRSIRLPRECPRPTLAVGGQLKGTFALGDGRHAILSHHLGDLDHFDAFDAFVRDIGLYERLFAVRPELIVHDLHPDYASSHYALGRAEVEGIATLGVQHHHAHIASGMAEHGLDGPVIGLAFDGTGYGTDGAIWGGEFLVGDCRGFRRAGYFRYVGMPGGDSAAREPWRMALAHLEDAGATADSLERRTGPSKLRTVRTMLARRFNTPPTSSVGRLFDAAASLAGVRDRIGYEGQAAMELEWLATEVAADGAYPFELQEVGEAEGPTFTVDTRPLIRAIARDAGRGVGPGQIGRRFHSTMVEIVATACGRIRDAGGPDAVVLSGGVFLNALLTREVVPRLEGEGFRVYRQRLVPPGDGGLSLGQLAIAAAIDRG